MNLNETASKAMAVLDLVLDENTSYVLILGHPAEDDLVIAGNTEPNITSAMLQRVGRTVTPEHFTKTA